MDLNNTQSLYAVMEWIRENLGDRTLSKREFELIALLDVLLRGCTPYLGHHTKVENALATFEEKMIP